MAFGFPAYHEETARFRGVPRQELRRAAQDALDDLGWGWHREGSWRIVASVPAEFIAVFFTWGAKVTVEVEEEEIRVRSEGTFALAWMDVGQHQANTGKFLRRLDEILEEAAP
jgi:hypothetical protein